MKLKNVIVPITTTFYCPELQAEYYQLVLLEYVLYYMVLVYFLFYCSVSAA